jgi:peptidoglycan/xylan/chitin deacetylase (PgdA/CDA1 family)
MYFVKTPLIVKLFFRNLIWNIDEFGNKIFLTFDDGPEPAVTPKILEILDKYKAKATFFCVGKKVVIHPGIPEQAIRSGHAIGNHSYSHIRGKKNSDNDFFSDIDRCNEMLKSNLFRPPYGSITLRQLSQLKKKYKIVMWEVLPGDFDNKISPEKCLSRSIRYSKSGTIIVFHDNQKSKDKVLYILPRYLEHFSKLGYTFEALNETYLK